jgi:hypothetical protein
VSWQGAEAAWAFDIGVLAEAPAFVLTFYLFLAYPMGRVEPPAARWLMGVLVVGVLAFFLPWALFSPVIAGGGPLTSCAPACPQSVVQIGTAPDLVEVAGKAETYTALAVTLAVLVVYALRIRAATRPQRRALAAVAVTSLLFMPAYFVVNFASQVLHAAPETVADLAWAIVVRADPAAARLPRGVAAGRPLRVRGAASAAAAPVGAADTGAVARRGRDGARRRRAAARLPGPGDRDASASPTGRRWSCRRPSRTAHGCRSSSTAGRSPRWWSTRRSPRIPSWSTPPRRRRSWRSRTAPSKASCGRPARVRSRPASSSGAGSSATSTTPRSSGSSRCGSTSRSPGSSSPRPRTGRGLERLDLEVEQAIEDLRQVAHGATPDVLDRDGLVPALRDAVAHSPMPVRIEAEVRAATPRRSRSAVYFCCLECCRTRPSTPAAARR